MESLELYTDKIVQLLKYDPANPVIFSSGLFLFAFFFFSLFYTLLKKRFTLRIIYVLLFSFLFYYKTSGMYFLLLIALSVSDYLIGKVLYRTDPERKGARKWLVALSVAVNLGVLCYFKYAALLVSAFSAIVRKDFALPEIFLPIGISFFTFQSMSYIIDLYRGKLEPVKRWLDYIFYLSFFPQLVAGPIVRAKEFLPQIYSPVMVTKAMFGTGLFFITTGLFKKAIISDYISINFVNRIFDAPMLYSGFENLMGIYGYAMQIYCDFSGYSDMAIGIALLLGFHFPQNFDSPYKSATITEFWRRWHMSLSFWLKDYLYISLGGNRKGKARTYVNLMITMLLGGLWHGAAVRFIIWGGLHGVALAVHKLAMDLFPGFKPLGSQMGRGRRILGIIFTFHLVCLGWVFFRAENITVVRVMLRQIFTDFNAPIIPDVIAGYSTVFLLIAIGYFTHFLPQHMERWAVNKSIAVPAIVHVAVISFVVWGVMQIKSSAIQPFIYFQF